MFNKRAKPRPHQISTLVGKETHIVGDVRFTGGLHVDGHIQGNVESSADGGTLSVSDGGVVQGSVLADHVVLNGTVTGDIVAQERVELGATARVAGNVYYNLIEMAMGAQINGKLIYKASTAGVATGAGEAVIGAPTPTYAEVAH
jgi:cytoskeletal protein CcmA (bactofilin family)